MSSTAKATPIVENADIDRDTPQPDIHVEERQPTGVLVHQDEGRRVHGVHDVESPRDALRDLGLARPEIAPQAHKIAGLGDPSEALPQGDGLGRGRRPDAGTEIGGGHVRRPAGGPASP